MQVRPKIEELKDQLVKTKQQKKAYKALNGKRKIKEIAKIASYKNKKGLASFIPNWERKGLILSFGLGAHKKYVNIENLDIQP